MKAFVRALRPALISFAAFSLLFGVAYTGLVTAVAQLAFPQKANGSIVTETLADGTKKACGSALIAQSFTKSGYLIGRPAGTSNLSPAGEKQRSLVAERASYWHSLDPLNAAAIPPDLLTASGSGVDPNISPEAAEYQVARIARSRGVSETSVRDAIARNTSGRFLGVFGERAVNVLKVNLSLGGLP
jgi:K+-transporting ATPase ATPase C chain